MSRSTPAATAANKHLDLGCGDRPRNPYLSEQLFGVDIREHLNPPIACTIKAANLSCDPIPFESSFFSSVSAYDFFEHVPRVRVDHLGKTHFPFIDLMNEVWRVLIPGGLLYAITPAFPHESAWRDPTHVNVITHKTVMYFTEPHLMARMYGFSGQFKLVRQLKLRPRHMTEGAPIYVPETASFSTVIRNCVDVALRRRSHLLWEFQAVK